jgi:ribosomal 30S subunit maturation factor RimM
VAGDRERLLPFVPAYVMKVDLQARRIEVDWPADW